MACALGAQGAGGPPEAEQIATDGESSEGFPVWKVHVDGREGLLAVAEYDEITLVQLRLPQEGISVSMR